ncbi:pantetheine-phosphate adenylyltransferase [Paenibacillus filicis]|uniref:Phosphopantetheine adenylyltransferase n=1 Tax=Paenibacillus gyeongsangnamensis TaxID=3388067 RepID=A0ABT4Q4V3_9BACL|nr:pantetheine-phosphate adenylyltransferase [Paenibacillus filicis]MCZ8511876.1 pantetheine-phosphate adenylyltransferase [Paenibacillus filicis]
MEKIAIYPGSFDPLTNGHMDIIERGVKLFDHLIVAVLVNAEKNPLFTLEERMVLIGKSISHIPNASVISFTGLTVSYARQRGASFILRGLRAVSDYEYELQLANTNLHLDPEIETVLMMTSKEYSFLSSSVVKGAARLGGNVSGLVPQPVLEALRSKFSQV